MTRNPGRNQKAVGGRGWKLLLAALMVNSIDCQSGWAQSFSCPIGKQPSCLDYSDKVCSSLAKCVPQDAIVFDSYACDFHGFICKSKFDDVASDYEALRTKFNTLVDEDNNLRTSFQTATTALMSEKRASADLQSKVETIQSCIRNASTVEEAKECD